ncbi:MAG: Rho termination factor N-terminal domain-containing protein, partial [Bacteroidota bacterium]
MYTETELNEKLVGELKSLASSLSIDNLENLTKKEIIEQILLKSQSNQKSSADAPKKRGRKPKVAVKIEDDPLIGMQDNNDFE